MRDSYDFSKAKRNPYAQLKRQVTIRLDVDTLEYFKALAAGQPHPLPDADQSLPSGVRRQPQAASCSGRFDESR